MTTKGGKPASPKLVVTARSFRSTEIRSITEK